MPEHPSFGSTDRAAEVRDAMRGFVAELQGGLDGHDADVYNSSFAGDVIWGGPFGAVVLGYDALHEIHQGLLASGAAGRSHYEIVNVVSPLPDVAIAHVRRRPVDDDDQFAEMALYVMVKRTDRWWLVAGQNTPIQPGRSATD